MPDWLPNKMGNYYLYFADHKGLYIRLAYADSIIGPWQIHEPGSLQIEESYFTPTRPTISEERLNELVAARRVPECRYHTIWPRNSPNRILPHPMFMLMKPIIR